MSSDLFFDWILPPLLGAVIGYITNWLAIKMLFRPLTEKRLLGLRLPFTPGLLPREKARLARSIGQTVAEELLTEDVVRDRLADPELKAAVAKELDARLEALLAADAGGLLSGLGEATKGPLASLAREAWEGLLRSEAFSAALAAAFRSALSVVEDLPLARLLPPERARELAELALAPDRLDEAVRRLTARLEAWYASADDTAKADEPAPPASEPLPLFAGLLPVEALEPLVRVLAEALYRAALPVIEGFMRSPEMRRGLERSANEIVRRAVSRLNLFQRLIVGAAQYERTLAESMPDTVDDLLNALSSLLRSPAMPLRAADAAVAALRSGAASGPAALLRRLITREAALGTVVATLEALKEHGPSLAERVMRLVQDHPEASVGTGLAVIGLPPEELSRRASTALALSLSGEGEGSRLLARSAAEFAGGLTAALAGQSLGGLLGSDAAFRRRLATALAERSLTLVSAEAGKIIAGLDVERIVVAKIDSLNMLEVERIILSVVDKELRWITLLGGILGGLIGMLQSLAQLLR